MKREIGPDYCHTLGCPNKRWQGTFRGDFCYPCYEVYSTGIVHEREARSGRWYGTIPRLEHFANVNRYDAEKKAKDDFTQKLSIYLGQIHEAMTGIGYILAPGTKPEKCHRECDDDRCDYEEDDDSTEDDTIGENFLGMGSWIDAQK